LGYSAFITTATGGDLIIVSGMKQFFLPQETIRDLLLPECTRPLLLPGGVVDGKSTVSVLCGEDVVRFTLHDRMFSVPWPEFMEVFRGDVQWAPLKLVSGRRLS